MSHPSPRVLALLVCVALAIGGSAACAAPKHVEVPMNGSRQAETVAGYGLPSYFGPADYHYAVFRLGPLSPGRRYEATLTFDAGTNIGYGTSWVDGDPSGKEYASFVGTGTGTGTREMISKEAKYLFTVDAKSTAPFLYLVVSSNRPWKLGVSVTDRLSGANPSTQDKWGYYYVTDFDADRTLALPAHARDSCGPGSGGRGIRLRGRRAGAGEEGGHDVGLDVDAELARGP